MNEIQHNELIRAIRSNSHDSYPFWIMAVALVFCANYLGHLVKNAELATGITRLHPHYEAKALYAPDTDADLNNYGDLLNHKKESYPWWLTPPSK